MILHKVFCSEWFLRTDSEKQPTHPPWGAETHTSRHLHDGIDVAVKTKGPRPSCHLQGEACDGSEMQSHIQAGLRTNTGLYSLLGSKDYISFLQPVNIISNGRFIEAKPCLQEPLLEKIHPEEIKW